MNYSRFSLVLIFLLPFLLSQDPAPKADGDYVPGELIIMLDAQNGKTQDAVLGSFLQDFSHIGMQAEKQLSRRMKIWTVSYDHSRTEDQALLSSVEGHPGVIEAQFNHYIELRENIPSDQYFDLQWNMHNTGQSGGQADADIDGPEAWDITTGGTTIFGDTIIVAIVDDGFDIGHGDITFWKNWHEIPGNGIDDDNNGYTDDYDGWNSWSHTGNIIMRDHGTHVSGIAAADGDNDMGVCGVNWNTRVLPIVGSATVESIVVEAYGYVYEMRTRYNETGGAEGAFIVATNSSFGINLGQPEDYPIWGAMYDSMGMAGVLSAAATANANWDIDEVGDVPTAMESDYLISVTNTTHEDLKSPSAGYGETTIDLGAPGTSVYSTRQGDSYGYKSGTSMASPHVAGAVALMFGAADSAFMEAYYEDPAAMALLIKQYILEGADRLDDLEGQTVTGGRLNIFNSINLFASTSLSVLPGQVNKDIYPNTIDNGNFQIINSSEEMPVDFSISLAAAGGWLQVVPINGTVNPESTQNINLTFNTSNRKTGIYHDTVIVTYGIGLQIFVPVKMTIIHPLLPDPDAISTVLEIDQSESVPISLANASLQNVIFQLSLEELVPWISFEPAGGTVSGSGTFDITFDMDALGIDTGNYFNQLFVSYNGLDTVFIPIDIRIEPPVLALDPEVISIELAPNYVDSAMFTLTNHTDALMPFEIEEAISELWLDYEPESGNIDPGSTREIVVYFNSQALPLGAYANTLNVHFNTDGTANVEIRMDVIETGIDDKISALEYFQVTPNPVRDQAFISFALSEPIRIECSIYALDGRKINILADKEFYKGNHRIEWPAGLEPGTYLIRLTDGKGSATKKVVVFR